MSAYFCDCHVHTSYSSDSSTPMEDMIKKAIELGLKEITLTDHVDYLPDGSPFPFQIDYDLYIKELESLKEKYKKRIRIHLGVETGLGLPHLKRVEDFLSHYPFSFIIGSSHETESKDLYNGDYFIGKKKEQAYNIYFDEVLENIKLYKSFHVYGHLDYIRRYGGYKDNTLRYEDYQERIDAILKELILRGKGLELNTSGYRYGLNQTHPQLAILKKYRQLGGEIITIGSDSHRTADVCGDFDKGYEVLEGAGFKAITVFRDGIPFWIDL